MSWGRKALGKLGRAGLSQMMRAGQICNRILSQATNRVPGATTASLILDITYYTHTILLKRIMIV